MDGYVKLYRKMVGWGWYKDPNTKSLFLHLLLMAQYEPTVVGEVFLGKGECLVSMRGLAEQTGLTMQSLRTSIRRLKSTHEITQTSTHKYSVITINNWAYYQSKEDEATQRTTQESTYNQHSSNTVPTLYKKDKKEKKEKKELSKRPYGPFENVLLTDTEYESLYVKRDYYIDKLSKYIESTGKRYRSHYATILNWMDKDGTKNEPPKAKPVDPPRNPEMDERMRNLVNQLRTDNPR